MRRRRGRILKPITTGRSLESRALELALKYLPRRQRQAVELRLRGHTLKKVARLMNVSPRTAETHIYLAIRKLRKSVPTIVRTWKAAELAYRRVLCTPGDQTRT